MWYAWFNSEENRLEIISSELRFELWTVHFPREESTMAMTYLSFADMWMYHQTITYQVTGAICYASHIVISRRVPHWGKLYYDY